MSVMRTLILAGMASLISAYTPPTNATWGALLTPDTTHPVTQGQSFTVTWDPAGHSTDGVTVSLVLCKGPSTNCVAQSTAIVEGVPASQKSYNWAVPCSLTPGVQATETGYGILIIVDGTGEFQYSTQFSVLANPTCAAVSSAPAVSSSVSPSAPASQSSAPAPNPSNTWEYWSSSSAAAVSSSPASSAPVKTTVSTIVTSAAPVSASSSMMTTHAPVPTSAITSAAVSASSSKPVSTFTGAAPQITSGAIGVVAAAAFAVFAL